MDRIDRIGPRDHERLTTVVAPVRVERSERDPDRDREPERRRDEGRRRRPAPPDGVEVHPAEPGHIDVSV